MESIASWNFSFNYEPLTINHEPLPRIKNYAQRHLH
jgi:hypothetical protein